MVAAGVVNKATAVSSSRSLAQRQKQRQERTNHEPIRGVETSQTGLERDLRDMAALRRQVNAQQRRIEHLEQQLRMFGIEPTYPYPNRTLTPHPDRQHTPNFRSRALSCCCFVASRSEINTLYAL
ncbi:hypothetical protein CGERO_00185 [Corynebacterium gerontici]|uniref:Uncharacterized protein n=1 Tax=Corynebacterium gerontici TaxID=2079234 RepID=A0A3G6IX90_9CORY|nr:hypothetical protein CGERO_00185 [Corynebacterium gerontici]